MVIADHTHAYRLGSDPMSDPNQVISFAGLALLVVALLMIGGQVVSIVRDSDTWVIVRGMTRGRFDRIRRRIKPRRA